MAEVSISLSLKNRRETAAGLAQTEQGLQDVADAGQDVSRAGAEAARGLDKATDRRFARGFATIGRGAKSTIGFVGRGIAGAARTGAYGLGILSVAATGASIKAIGLAGDARETASAFNTVFGPAAKDVQKDLDGMTRKFGLYNPELQDATRQFGVFGKAAGVARKELPGFSTDLTKAGLDLASFYNVDTGTAFEALQSGLSGESEPLRQFGIFLSDASLNAYAAAEGIGKTTKEMTEQEKVALRQAFILKNLGDAQGDLARTSQGFANQQREAGNRTKAFLTLLGGPLTTAATGAYRGFNNLAKAGIKQLTKELPGLEKGAGSLATTFEKWGRQGAKGLPDALDKISSAGSKVGDFFTRAKGFVSGIDWGSTSAGLASIGDSISGADWGAIGEGLGSGTADSISVFSVAIGFAADHVDTLAKYMPLLVAGFVAYKTAQAAANVVGLAHVPILFAQVGANVALASANRALATQMAVSNGVERTGMVTRAASTAGMVAQKAVTLAVSTATKVWAAAQWLLNAALTANPIGLVVVAIAALVGGFILLYKKSETFRGIVNGLWNNVLKPFGKWIGGVLIGYVRTLAVGWLTMARFGVSAFRKLLTAAFAAFGGILAAAEAGLGWIPFLKDKIKAARVAFDTFSGATVDKLRNVESGLKRATDKANELGRDRSATITVRTQFVGPTTGPYANAQQSKLDGMFPDGRANGGFVRRGTTYLVGERGPEFFKAPSNGLIVPNHKLPSVPRMRAPVAPDNGGTHDSWDAALDDLTADGGFGGHRVIEVPVYLDRREIARAVWDETRDQMARG